MSDDMPMMFAQLTGEQLAAADPRLAQVLADPLHPLHTAYEFFNAVNDLDTGADAQARATLARVCLPTSNWGDFTETKTLIGERGISDHVQPAKGRPDQLVYVGLIDVGDQAVEILSAGTDADALIINLLRPDPQGPWFVIALTRGGGLGAGRVFGDTSGR
jgi:hypothetical protein